MARKDRTSEAVDRIIDWVLEGEIPAGESLPPEAELAGRCEVSRLTVREAIRLLQAQGVVEKVPGTRHRVVPVEEWTGLYAIVRMDRQDPSSSRSSIELLELRMMIETEAATRAATRRTDAHLERLRTNVERMQDAHARTDVSDFVVADLEFHETLMRAAENRILVATMRTLTELLDATRTETSSTAEIREHAISWHIAVLDAVTASDAKAARSAMTGHMQQTYDDLMHFVFGRQDTPGRSAPGYSLAD